MLKIQLEIPKVLDMIKQEGMKSPYLFRQIEELFNDKKNVSEESIELYNITIKQMLDDASYNGKTFKLMYPGYIHQELRTRLLKGNLLSMFKINPYEVTAEDVETIKKHKNHKQFLHRIKNTWWEQFFVAKYMPPKFKKCTILEYKHLYYNQIVYYISIPDTCTRFERNFTYTSNPNFETKEEAERVCKSINDILAQTEPKLDRMFWDSIHYSYTAKNSMHTSNTTSIPTIRIERNHKDDKVYVTFYEHDDVECFKEDTQYLFQGSKSDYNKEEILEIIKANNIQYNNQHTSQYDGYTQWYVSGKAAYNLISNELKNKYLNLIDQINIIAESIAKPMGIEYDVKFNGEKFRICNVEIILVLTKGDRSFRIDIEKGGLREMKELQTYIDNSLTNELKRKIKYYFN